MVPREAHAQNTERCVAAAEQAQNLRDQRKLHAARDQLLACVQLDCPTVVTRDCQKWLGEVDDMMPSIAVAAHGGHGAEYVDVRVYVDGVKVADALDGKAIPVDPGLRALRFEREGSAPVEMRVLLREGERHRPIDVTFLDAAANGGASTPSGPVPPPSGEGSRSAEAKSPPVAGFILAGTAVVAFGSFAYFAIRTHSDVSSLQTHCAPACSSADVDPVRREALAADISLGVGLLSAAGAVWLFVRHARDSRAHAAVHPVLMPRGAALGIAARW